MTFVLGHANIENPDRLSDQLHTIREVASHCDVATWNEADDTRSALRAMAGWDETLTGGIGITWKAAKFELVGKGSKRVMTGGRNKGRRLGPSRYVLYALLREKATGRGVIIATHHSIAKADTDNKWRRPFRSAGWRSVVATLASVKSRHTGPPLILTGDFNTIGKITAFVSLGIREAKTPATFGKRLRYDRIYGDVSNVRTLTTKSDHKALLATVTLGPATIPPPTPEVPMARQARSLDVLLAEVNKAAPNRNKASDGGLGDPRHAAGVSDHNPNSSGVWRARDITNDPGDGCDANRIANNVAAILGKHPALGSGAYVIWNRRIISTSRLREGWRRYSGSNPHDKHVHVSVGTRGYDSTAPWNILAPKEKSLNNVEEGRADIARGLAHLAKAKGRPVVAAQAAVIRAALALMPKK